MPVSRSRKKKPKTARGGARTCSGFQLDHDDGSMSCTRGQLCSGIALNHQGWGGCAAFGPCAHCSGPPVAWVH